MEKPKEEIKKRKYFFITRNKEKCRTRELKEYFEDPNKFLSKSRFLIGNYCFNNNNNTKLLKNKNQNKTITKLSYKIKNENDNINNINKELFDKIGAKTTLNHLNRNRSLSPKNKKRCISAFNEKRNISNNVTVDNFKKGKLNSRNLLKSAYSFKYNISSSPIKGIHYVYKTKKEIIDIFNNYNQKEKNKEIIKSISKKINDIINHKYLIQEKNLKTNEEEKKNMNNISKYLSKKCERKENNLLFNKIENFNLKRQILNYLYKNKLLSEKLGNNYWKCDLRRNKDGHKINYVITGRNDKEPWEQIVDSGDVESEFFNNPNCPITINNSRGTNHYKLINNYPNMKSLNQIKVEGKNLFLQEYNHFIHNISKKKHIKYRLYKDPQEYKSKSINELIYKENYRPFSRKKKFNLKKNFN